MAIAIGFDAAFEFRQFGIRRQFSPAAQVKIRLEALWRQLNGQRGHVLSIGLKHTERNSGTAQVAQPLSRSVPSVGALDTLTGGEQGLPEGYAPLPHRHK